MQRSDSIKQAGPPKAIVIGLDCVTGLQTARILAQHKVPVVGIASDPSKPFCRTKVCEKIIFANTESHSLIDLLITLGPELGERAVLFPCSDASVLLLSRNRKDLEEWYHIGLPDSQVVETLMDKVGFYRYAEKAGLPIPRTFIIANEKDLELVLSDLTFPCILKPPLKTPLWEKNSRAKVLKIPDAESLLLEYRLCSKWAELLMVQEWIEGTDADLFSCNCYFNDKSTPLVTFISRKIRQWPPETGVSSLGEECRNDVVLRETIRLFQSVGYQGLGYLEMKCDARTGKHFIIEPNIGRPTARSAIAEAGGVPLLYTAYCDMVKLPLPENRQQKYGNAKWVYLRRDILSAIHYWRKGTLSLSGWLRSWRGLRKDAVFSWSDQLPFWLELWRCSGLLSRKLRSQSKAVQMADTRVG